VRLPDPRRQRWPARSRARRDAQACQAGAEGGGAWLTPCRDPWHHPGLHRLRLERTWPEPRFGPQRLRRVTTPGRPNGLERGSGGASGVVSLPRMLDMLRFPRTRKLRTDL
jgi:tryptophan 2,3-dioxygenase